VSEVNGLSAAPPYRTMRVESIMSIVRISACIAAFSFLLALTPRVEAQREIHHIPPSVSSDGNNPDLAHPFIDPLAFDPDWNFFAPADVEPFGGGPEVRTGWFATYDRMNIWSSRPKNQVATNPTGDYLVLLPDNKGLDSGWGNRFDVGYMTEEDHGWTVSYWNLRGPNYYSVVHAERINVYQPLDQINSDPANTIDLRSGEEPDDDATTSRIPGIPESDRNDPATGYRTVPLYNSVNVSNMANVELNKTFRMPKLAYGSTVEPFFGVRYMRFGDVFNRATYNRYDTNGFRLGLGIPPEDLPPELGPVTNYDIEEYRNYQAIIENHMIGGQLGLRVHKRKTRWLLSGEARAFAMQNFQDIYVQDGMERTYYDGTGVGAEIETITVDLDSTSGHAAEFVWGGEVRAEAAYEFTRDFALRVGFTYLQLGRGIARGGDLLENQQGVTMFGTTMGFTINR